MAVLVCLAENEGQVVTRAFFHEHVWRGSVVTDHALTNCISELRQQLGDTCGTPRFIETVPKRGYRLIAPVTSLEEQPEPATRPSSRRQPRTELALGLAVVVIVGIWWAIAANPGASVANIREKSIAVLPFENLSADQKNDYFVAGMQDMILTKLADIDELKVISRASTMEYKSHPNSVKQIAAELGVATILEGSVQKVGNEVLINVQLINARNDSHLWAESYQRTLNNVFGVEGEVAGKIAKALHAQLSPAETTQLAAVPTTDPVAYNLFLRAEYEGRRAVTIPVAETRKAAILLYRQAIAEDPGFALAYARLSYSESILAWYGAGGEDVKPLIAQARADAERALEVAPDLATAHVAIGYSEYYGRQDYAPALKAFDAALILSPGDVGALRARGLILRRLGRFNEAIASFTQARAHDPRNFELTYQLGKIFMHVSRYPEAETWLQRTLALNPNSLPAKRNFARAVLLRTGDVGRALSLAQGDALRLKLLRVDLLTLQRKYREAIALLKSIPDTPDTFYLGSKALELAELYRLAGVTSSARQSYADSLPKARAELARLQGIYRAIIWSNVARNELGLGHITEGLEAIAEAQAIVAKSGDQVHGPILLKSGASLYALAGRPDLAVPLLAKALATPGIGIAYSPVLLWLDPDWDPIRDDPRFQALLKQYAKYQPEVTYHMAGAGALSFASASTH